MGISIPIPDGRSSRRILALTGALVALAATMAACGSESVSGLPAGAITITPHDPSVRLGETVRLTATIASTGDTEATGESRRLFWSSSDETIATVDADGLVTPRALGTAQIAASAGGESGVVEVRVLEMAVGAVRLRASSATPAVGDTIDLTVTVLGRGDVELTGRSVTVRSLTPAVLEMVGGRGVARREGTVSLVAESEGVADTLALEVRPAPVRQVDVTPSSVTLEVGATARLGVEAYDRSGQPLAGRAAAFASSATSIATVTGEGVVRGVRAGTATITVTVEGVSATASVTVREPPRTEPEPPPPSPPPPPPPPPPAASAARIEIVAGGFQIGSANRFLPTRPTVRVLSADGKPVRGVTVRWRASDGGMVNDDQTVTDSDGRTSTRWRLSRTPGVQQLTATVSGVDPATFRAVGLPGGGDDDDDDDDDED